MDQIKHTFIQIIARHHGIIGSICSVYYKDPEERKDARQDVLVQLWRAFPNFRSEASITTWLYRVTLNTILARKRDEQREVLMAPRARLDDDYDNSVAFSDDHIQSLKTAIGLLNPQDKAIVILFLEGYDYREIAGMLDLTITNVSTRMHRIRERLKQLYKTRQHEH